jgi:hypothetical protein
MSRITGYGPAEGRMWNRIWGAALRKPAIMTVVARILFQYAQARYMFDRGGYWEPKLSFPPVAPEPVAKPQAAVTGLSWLSVDQPQRRDKETLGDRQ